MFLFKRRAAYLAVVAALALFATGPAIPVVQITAPDGTKFIGYTLEEHSQLRALFLNQRERIEQLEDQLEKFKTHNGCI